jgi:hypothetical protein
MRERIERADELPAHAQTHIERGRLCSAVGLTNITAFSLGPAWPSP